MTYPCYIVAGGGRTGSHWIEQVIKFVLGEDYSGSVIHTHQFDELTNLDPIVQTRSCLVMARRRDIFAQTMSLAVAEHTDEWFVYTDREIKPFDIDPERFFSLMRYCQTWNQQFNATVRPLYPTVVDIDYEDLVSNIDRIEDYVAQQIGVLNTQGSKSWDLNRNPRDYRKIVQNWDDLWTLSQNRMVSGH